MEPEPDTRSQPSVPADRAARARPGAVAADGAGAAASTPGAQEPVAEGPAKPPGGLLLRGTTVAPGMVLGRVHRKDSRLAAAPSRRVPLDRVEGELNRFHRALVDSRRQLEDLKGRLSGRIPADHARILDTHVAYLKDSVFLADVENLILNEQMALEAAIAKVVTDFDRIFRLVENETLRERAVDLRDVGIRVLRNLELAEEPRAGATEPPSADYVLVARELSIVDMFSIENEHVLGIVTEEGGLTSHAAILARSMRIPTLTGVDRLLDRVREGDFVILDATEGVVRVDPDELVRAQYVQARKEAKDVVERPRGASLARARTADGVEVCLGAVCGNLPEVEQGVEQGLEGVALYRTELLYLVERVQPSVDALRAHYAAVVERAGGPVVFRLLDVDSSLEVPYLHEAREQNPALGMGGVRALLAHDQVLRAQLRAILCAAPDADPSGAWVGVAVPFVTDCGDLRRVKEVLFEERVALRRTQEPHAASVRLGAVLETPAAALGVRDLAAESDFLALSLDSLVQHLLAADRENHELRHVYDRLHPIVLRVLADVVAACRAAERPLTVFGVTAVRPTILPFLLGVGVRSIGVAPVGAAELAGLVAGVSTAEAARAAELLAQAPCPEETETLVDRMRRGPGA